MLEKIDGDEEERSIWGGPSHGGKVVAVTAAAEEEKSWCCFLSEKALRLSNWVC